MPETDGAPLRGLAVLVTRPIAQAGALCALIEAAGGVALRLPLLEIARVHDELAASARLEAQRGAERWIFSSTNAVEQAARLAPPPWPPVAAVGAATAAALRARGCVEILAPEQGDGASALLERNEFAAVDGKHYAIVCGERPLPTLEAGLHARGADVESIAVYRRVPLQHPPQRIEQALAQAAAIVVASGEALRHLYALTPDSARACLLARQLVLPSRRVVETASELGFAQAPLVPARVADAAFVEALIQRFAQVP